MHAHKRQLKINLMRLSHRMRCALRYETHSNGLHRARAVCCCVEQSAGAASATCAHAAVKVQNSLLLRCALWRLPARPIETGRPNKMNEELLILGSGQQSTSGERSAHRFLCESRITPPTAPLTHMYIYCNASWDCFLKKKHQWNTDLFTSHSIDLYFLYIIYQISAL